MPNKKFVLDNPLQDVEEQQQIARYKKRWSALDAMQTNYKPLYQELAVLCDPKNAYFQVKRAPGDLSHLVAKTDDTAQTYLPIHAAVMNSLLTPAAYLWHRMQFLNSETQDAYGPQLDVQNRFIYNKRYSAASNFICAINTLYMNNAVYGWYVLEMTKDLTHKQVCYRALPVTEFVIDQNERGFVDTFYRKVEMTYRRLRQMFPNYVPKCAKDSPSDNPFQWLDRSMCLMHVVEPSLTESGKFDSVYMDLNDNTIIEKTVEKHSKYIAGRAATFSNTNDPYGFSPMMSVMPSVKNLNAISFDLVKAAHHASRFDLVAGDDIVNPKNYPDVTSIINGGFDSEGHMQVGVLSQRDMPTLDYMVNGWRQRIKDALFVEMFSILQETQSRSATDAMLKANERANIIAPMGDRFARELLMPMIELELQYYAEMHELPEFPEEAKGETFDIVLDNPMLRGQRLDSANAVSNMAASLAQVQPLESEFNMDETKLYLAQAFNIPQSLFNTPEQKQAIVEAQQQNAQMQMLMENANNIGSGVKNLMEANKASTAPSQ